MNFKKPLYFLIFIANFGIGHGMNDVIYIKSSANVSCPNTESHCLTLSQFAANNSWLRQNMTMILLPSSAENHTLSLEMNIFNITNFSILSNGDSKVFINCQQNGSLSFTDVDQVWVRRLWFFGCGNNIFLSVKRLKVEDCTFQGQGDSGTALIIYDCMQCSSYREN